MAYAAYIRQLLEPLGLYDLEQGASCGEIEALGSAFDQVMSAVGTLEEEATVVTASGQGLRCYEELLPFQPAASSLELRRRAVAALLHIDGRSFTKAALNETLLGCGIPAVVEETGDAFTVAVSFPEHRGIPEGMSEIRTRIEQILPCHLQVHYAYRFPTWGAVESAFPLWSTFLEADVSWELLERME